MNTKLCPSCYGSGCEDCDYEGVVGSVFNVNKIIKKKSMDYQTYQNKKDKELSKIDKKNIREEL